MRVILLAAGVGKRFGAMTKRVPKCLIPLTKDGLNLLSRYLASFKALGLKDIDIVVGHERIKIKKECARKGKGLRVRFIVNREYRKGSLLSLYKASKAMNQSCLIMDADVYFPVSALRKLLKSKHSACFLADRSSKSTGEEMMIMARNGRPFALSKKIDLKSRILGESIGFFRTNKTGAIRLRKILNEMVHEGQTGLEYEESYSRLMKKMKVGVESIRKVFWTEMDFKKDLEKIKRHLKNNQ